MPSKLLARHAIFALFPLSILVDAGSATPTEPARQVGPEDLAKMSSKAIEAVHDGDYAAADEIFRNALENNRLTSGGMLLLNQLYRSVLNETGLESMRGWQEASDAHFADVVVGSLEVRRAWEERGGRLARYVSSEQWEGFYRHLAKAEILLAGAWEENPSDSYAPYRMISVAGGGGEGVRGVEKWFDRAMAAHCENTEAVWRAYHFLRPRWSGSLTRLHEFVLGELQDLPDTSEKFRVYIRFRYNFGHTVEYSEDEIAARGWYYPDFLETYEAWRSAFPRSEDAYILSANILRAVRDYESAARAARDGLAVFPDHGELLVSLGKAEYRSRDLDEAEETFGRLIELNQELDEAYTHMGFIMAETGRMAEAVENFLVGIDYVQDDDIKLSRHYYGAARASLDLEQYEEARAYAAKALEKDPEHAWTHRVHGSALYRLDRHEEARDAFDRAVELDPAMRSRIEETYSF